MAGRLFAHTNPLHSEKPMLVLNLDSSKIKSDAKQKSNIQITPKILIDFPHDLDLLVGEQVDHETLNGLAIKLHTWVKNCFAQADLNSRSWGQETKLETKDFVSHCKKLIKDAAIFTYFISPAQFLESFKSQDGVELTTLLKFNLIRLLFKDILEKRAEEDRMTGKGAYNPIFKIPYSILTQMGPPRTDIDPIPTERDETTLTYFISKIYSQILKMEYKTQPQLLKELDRSEFARDDALSFELHTAVYLAFKFAGEIGDPDFNSGLSSKLLVEFIGAIRVQYDEDSWADHPDNFTHGCKVIDPDLEVDPPQDLKAQEEEHKKRELAAATGERRKVDVCFKKVVQIDTWQRPRYFRSGVEPLVELCAAHQGILLHRKERWGDKKLRRFKYLLMTSAQNVNDFFSIVNDLNALPNKEREPLLVKLPKLIAKAEKEHEAVLREIGKIYENFKENYAANSNLIKYIDLMVEMIKKIISMHIFNGQRYELTSYAIEHD